MSAWMSSGFSRTPWISPSSSRPEESSDCRAAGQRRGFDYQVQVGDHEFGDRTVERIQ
jgi:hypothetical protein